MARHSTVLQNKKETEGAFDTHPEVSLDLKHIRKFLKNGYSHPFLLIDDNIIRNKTRRFKAAMLRVHPHYAAKANPDPRVLET